MKIFLSLLLGLFLCQSAYSDIIEEFDIVMADVFLKVTDKSVKVDQAQVEADFTTRIQAQIASSDDEDLVDFIERGQKYMAAIRKAESLPVPTKYLAISFLKEEIYTMISEANQALRSRGYYGLNVNQDGRDYFLPANFQNQEAIEIKTIAL